jgi:tetratricopeptide (TPR) repeat protein
MRTRAFLRDATLLIATTALAACAPLPPATDAAPAEPATSPVVRSDPAPRTSRGAFIARQVELANRARDAGDLPAAEEHWRVLALLEPNDPRFANALAATREAIARGAREQWQAGLDARRNGDTARARNAFLRTLALDPGHADAARALRELEHQAMAKSQGERAARARANGETVASARTRAGNAAAATDAYDLEQRLELMRAGDVQVGLRELRTWVEANPGERAARQRAGAAVADRARELESRGLRESALSLYEQAGALAGGTQAQWTARMQALRKALGEHYYAEGMKVFRTDLAAAIRHWEAGAKYDPSNGTLQLRLREAKLAQQKLQKIGER